MGLVVSAVLALLIFQLIRRKKLKEQYSLLWFMIVAVMLLLSIWGEPLTWLSEATGIQLPSNTLFVLAILFLFGMALHFSLLVSRLTDQSKMLAQKLALLDRDLRQLQDDSGEDESAAPAGGKSGGATAGNPGAVIAGPDAATPGGAGSAASGAGVDADEGAPPIENPHDERD